MNWGECKLLTLKKIDPAVNSLAVTRNTKDYLNSITGVANRGLQDLATSGKFITENAQLLIPPLIPAASTPQGEVFTTKDNFVMEHVGNSFYFEASGVVKITVTKGEDSRTFEPELHRTGRFKGVMPGEGKIRIEFNTDSMYSYGNIAIYSERYPSDEQVPEYSEKRRINLKEELDQFYQIINRNEFETEGESIIVVRGTQAAYLDIRYSRYPQEITDETPNDYELALDPEVSVLLPLYMASELVEDDDTSVAYYFRQQYDEAKAKLTPNSSETENTIDDVWGW